MKCTLRMTRFTKKKPGERKGGQDGPVTGFILLNILFLCVADFSGANPTTNVKTNSAQIWNFDNEKAGTLPSNFMVGTLVDSRPAGEWQVIDMKQSLSLLPDLDRREHRRIEKVLQALDPPSPPHVLAQLKNRGFNQDYNVALIERITATDFNLRVSFLPIAGKADMGGGLIWRAQDHQNYYLTRANPLEQNIRLYRVVKGVRYKLANFDRIISVKSWHTLELIACGSRFQVFFDEHRVLDVRDETFQSGGQIGLWTKADAVTYFDDLRLSAMK